MLSFLEAPVLRFAGWLFPLVFTISFLSSLLDNSISESESPLADVIFFGEGLAIIASFVVF